MENLKNEADVSEPLSIFQSREPLGTGGGETERLEAFKAFSHSMDVRDVKVG